MQNPLFAKRCLSIQSHVVHGYVGNKCAVFPLQLLGFDVDAINSVQLSTHTAYGSVKGQRLGGEEIETLLAGLRDNGLLGHSHILTGYNSSPAFLSVIARAVKEIREVNPGAVWCVDPVLGDHGRLYVPEAVIPVYRAEIVPLATILTPNQFEAETLTGVKITDIPSALAAVAALHASGARTVILTSTDLPATALPQGAGGSDSSVRDVNTMLCIASCPWDMVAEAAGSVFSAVADRSAHSHAAFAVPIPKLDSVFTGSGDLTAALLLAHATDKPGNLCSAVEHALASVRAVCLRTMAKYKACTAAAEAATAALVAAEGSTDSAGAGAATPASLSPVDAAAARMLLRSAASASGQMKGVVPAFNELALVQSAHDILHPVIPEGMRAVSLLS